MAGLFLFFEKLLGSVWTVRLRIRDSIALQKAASPFRRQIKLGFDKDSRASGKARVILHKLLGTIELRPGPDKSLWAEYELCPTALLKSAGTVGTAGTTG